MGNTHKLTAHTDLSMEEIHEILFDEIEIEIDPTDRRKFRGDGFYCTLGLSIEWDVSENWVLDAPENLDVTFHFGWRDEGFVNAMKVVMNWLKKTTGDCAFLFNVEIVLLLRVNGKTIRNSTEHAWFPDEAIELIDIPHEVKDLGVL